MEEKVTKATLRGIVLWLGSTLVFFKFIKIVFPLFLWGSIQYPIVGFLTYYGLGVLVSCTVIFILNKYLNSSAHPVSLKEHFKDKDVRRISGLLIALLGMIELAYDLPMIVQTVFIYRDLPNLSYKVLFITDLIQISYGLYLFKSKREKFESNKNNSKSFETA